MISSKKIILFFIVCSLIILTTGCAWLQRGQYVGDSDTSMSNQIDTNSKKNKISPVDASSSLQGLSLVPSGRKSYVRATQPQVKQIGLSWEGVTMMTREDSTYFTIDTRYSNEQQRHMVNCAFDDGLLGYGGYIDADPSCLEGEEILTGDGKTSGERQINNVILRSDESVTVRGGAQFLDNLIINQIDVAIDGDDLILSPVGDQGYLLFMATSNVRYSNAIAGSYESFEFGYSPRRGGQSQAIITVRRSPGMKESRITAGEGNTLIYGDLVPESLANDLSYSSRSGVSTSDIFYAPPRQYLLQGTPYRMQWEVFPGHSLEYLSAWQLFEGNQGELSSEVFSERTGGAEIVIGQYASFTQRSLTSDEEGVVTRSTLFFENPGNYAIVARDDRGFSYVWEFLVLDGLDYQQHENEEYLDVYLDFNVVGVTVESLQEAVNNAFGPGFMSVRNSYRSEHATVEPYYSSHIGDNEREFSSFTLTYYPVPGELYEADVRVETVFGTTLNIPLSLQVNALSPWYESLIVHDRPLNLLPSNGRWSNRLQVAFKNIQKPSVHMYRCELQDVRGSKDWIAESKSIGCDSQAITVPIIGTGARERWTLHEEIIEFPEQLQDAPIVLVKYWHNTNTDVPTYRYFIRSELGVFVKSAYERGHVTVWGRDLYSGELLQSGDVIAYDEDLNVIERATLDGGEASFTSLTQANEFALIEVVVGEKRGWVAVNPYGERWISGSDQRSLSFVSNISNYDLYESSPNDVKHDKHTERIYGYSDRGLYSPGDTIMFAGFVRDVAHTGTEEALMEGEVTVILKNVNGDSIDEIQKIPLDAYAGFTGSFVISDDAPLGVYYLEYTYFGHVRYTHEIRVEEFQKSTYTANASIDSTGDEVVLSLTPEYYFGGNLEDYDVHVAWTLTQSDTCRWCWYWSEEEGYTNHVFGTVVTSGGTVTKSEQFGTSDLSFLRLSDLSHQGIPLEGLVRITLTDALTHEIVSIQEPFSVEPKATITLPGQQVERQYGEEKVVPYGITVTGAYDRLVAQVLYKSYAHEYEYGIDGNRYVVDHQQMRIIRETEVSGDAVEVTLNEAGQYLLRVIAYQGETIVGENQKRINFYGGSGGWWSWFGRMENNSKLHVSVPKKSFRQGEEIPIDIEPYINGAHVLVTVEKGGTLLDSHQFVLDGSQPTIPVKPNYFPNVHISVIEVVGEEKNIVEKRSEPRFFIGYAEAIIDQHMVDLDIRVIPEKDTYEPGDPMSLRIETYDDTGNPVDARVSIAVVDKALADLYHLIKQPIPDFYYKVAAMVPTWSNMNYLYQMLNVLVQDGEKGGGGSTGLGSRAWRTELKDVAYWKGDVITENGFAEITTDLPDNLTTWLIDAIGITKGGRLGTTSEEVKVAKQVMIRPYLPAFVTYGDSIEVPVEIVLQDESSRVRNVDLTAHVSLFSGEDMRQLDVSSVDDQGAATVTLEVPDAWRDKLIIEVHLEATSSNGSDGVTYTLPHRGQGFFIYDHDFSFAEGGSGLVAPQHDFITGTYALHLQRFPVEALRTTVGYLLRYPYACTEQRSSAVLAGLAARKLDEYGLILPTLVNGEWIWYQDNRIHFHSMLQSYINEVRQAQMPDGGISFWSTYKKSNYPLSAYVRSVMKTLEAEGIEMPRQILEPLEGYLRTGGKSNPLPYTYLQRQFAQFGEEIDTDHLEEILEEDEQLPVHILAFASFAVAGIDHKAQELYDSLPWDEIDYMSNRTLDFYVNEHILRSILLRGLLAYNPKSHQEQIEKLVIDLLKTRDEQGRRGWSTQSNIQVVLSLLEYLDYADSAQRNVICLVSIGGETQEIELNDRTRSWSTRIDLGVTDVDWMCDSQVLKDATTVYMPVDRTLIGAEMSNVDYLDWQVDEGNPGDVVLANGGFVVSNEAEHVAVELFIPSTYTFLATRSEMNDEAPFEIEGGRECQPHHYEVRFDRLFLYYSYLPAGLRCEVIIDVIRGFEGTARQAPTALREMYQTRVRGRQPGQLPE